MESRRIQALFNEKFGAPEVVVDAPGRINLIGEHTDYNFGLALPAAIQLGISFAFTKGEGVNVFAADEGTGFTGGASDLSTEKSGWKGYLSAVVKALQNNGRAIPGFRCVFGGDLPTGAGLSSSAALCCGWISGLNALENWQLEPDVIAEIAQEAEHLFGLECGMMDQWAVMLGRKNQALFIDFDENSWDWVAGELPGFEWILLDSEVKHSLAETGYNRRRQEVNWAWEELNERVPAHSFVRSSRMGSEAIWHLLPELYYRRLRHVSDENSRVSEMVDALKGAEFGRAGQLLLESHKSLRDFYEVTCPETDFLVSSLAGIPEVMGARQMGGGFGGCVLALLKEGQSEAIFPEIRELYQHATGFELKLYPVKIADGLTVRKGEE